MNKQPQYKVVDGKGIAAFEQKVIESMKEGFIPQGGISIIIKHHYNYNTNRYAQAMVKY